jgi:hypothetical protein
LFSSEVFFLGVCVFWYTEWGEKWIYFPHLDVRSGAEVGEENNPSSQDEGEEKIDYLNFI